VCTEEMYPYNPVFFKDRPTEESYEFAYKNKHPIQYRRVRLLLEDIMKSISIKIPVLMGFTVYESFQHPDVARTGIMPVPKMGEKIVGHHCILIVGYDIPKKYLLCRNSWGSSWGQGGHFWMAFSFVNSRNCSDLWIISTGSGNKPSAKLTNIQKPVEKAVEKHIEKVPEFKNDDISVDEKLEEDDTIV
jgi:C1A family cysteine protease